MAWWRRKKQAIEQTSDANKVSVPRGLWTKCDACGEWKSFVGGGPVRRHCPGDDGGGGRQYGAVAHRDGGLVI